MKNLLEFILEAQDKSKTDRTEVSKELKRQKDEKASLAKKHFADLQRARIADLNKKAQKFAQRMQKSSLKKEETEMITKDLENLEIGTDELVDNYKKTTPGQ